MKNDKEIGKVVGRRRVVQNLDGRWVEDRISSDGKAVLRRERKR